MIVLNDRLNTFREFLHMAGDAVIDEADEHCHKEHAAQGREQHHKKEPVVAVVSRQNTRIKCMVERVPDCATQGDVLRSSDCYNEHGQEQNN